MASTNGDLTHGGAAVLDGASPSALERSARDHIWIHSMPWVEMAEEDGMHVFDRGEGSLLYDVHGREYIDGISGLWVVNAGHGRKEIGAVMGEQAGRLAYASSGAFTTVPAVKLGSMLSDLTPGDLNRIFYCSGGSEAVETAMKIAKQVQAMRGFPRRYKMIARRGSYHGMTFGAMSLTHGKDEAHFGPFMYGVSHVSHPNRYRSDFDLTGEAADIAAAKAVEQEILAQDPESVAAVIAEPVSTSAGVHVPSKIYWKMLRDICDKHGVLLIADEVIDGFGRTGTMFAIEQWDIVPDIMTVAKGLSSGYAPIAAAIVRDKVFEVFQDQKAAPLGHLLTFGGHAVAAAAAVKNLEIFKDEDLVATSAKTGAYLGQRLEELRSHPTVGDVRGVGMLWAAELVKNRESKELFGKDHPFAKRLMDLMMERGLITRVWSVIHFGPPLTTSSDLIDRIVTIVDESLTIAEGEFAGEITG